MAELRTLRPPPRPAGGWVFYDGLCPWCARAARLLGGELARRGFHLAPLQRGWVQDRLGLDPAQALRHMRLLTADGRVLGGADALVHVAACIWWARPLRGVSRLPGGMSLVRGLYRLISAHRHLRARPKP